MAKDFYKDNLDGLARQNPESARRVSESSPPEGASIQWTPSGHPTLVMAGVTFHSRYDPWREAENLANSEKVKAARAVPALPALFGFGLGYTALVLARTFEHVLVIEPDPGIIGLAFRHLDFQEAMPRLCFLVDTDSEVTLDPDRMILFLPHAPSVRLHPDAFEYWSGFFQGRTLGAAGTESAAQLARILGEIDGIRTILDDCHPEDRCSEKELIQKAKDRPGDLTEMEIYLLLLDAFTARPDRGPDGAPIRP